MSVIINSSVVINGSTKIITAADDAALWDASSLSVDLLGNTITNTGVTADTSVKMIGSQSAVFNGSGDLLSWPNNSRFYPGTKDFFFGVWARWTRYGAGNSNFIAGFGNGKDANTVMVAALNPSYYGNGISLIAAGANLTYYTSYQPSENVFHHVALSRSVNTYRVFIDGTLRGTFTVSGLNITSPFRIGSGWTSNGEHLNGYANSAQLVIGRPVTTSNFTITSPNYRLTV
jgi:hypothetical protein